ncbi:UDP-glycosyltransferase UGT5-like [Episyrphus balteatus]|uniref:UDP-glycosyltransferase UGT5-like n=1 Tax=Episyrphus balteatus TaxID=286459 RepID=UPI0024854F0D|nr:UDP-glycosyltransferase UGT5-like [Episyrphus balteatus]
MNFRKYFSIFFVLLLTASYSNGARILAAFVFPGKSHTMMYNAIIKELLQRGHEVTLITNFPQGNLLSNYKEVQIPVYDFFKDIKEHFGAKSHFDLTKLTMTGFMKMLDIIGEKATEHALQQPNVQEIFNRTDTNDVYDLLLVSQFYQEAFLTLGLKYNVPIVTSSTLGYENFMSHMMGIIQPWSFVPHGFLPYDDRMDFVERVTNSIASLYEDLHREYIYLPKHDALVKKYLSHLPIKFPKMSEMERNVSLILLNSHAPITTPRPTITGMVPVGGLHIYPPKPLPADIKKFLDDATDGAIYFSLGTNIKSADMPPEKMKLFLEVFSTMKQRILWKFEADKVPKLPKNVMVQKWMPQNDILAHPNVKVFITHGGLFGSQEGVYHGVPMLGMPFFCDQYLNLKKATKAGYAISLSFPDITKEGLNHSLTELLENPFYRENMKRISEIFRDRPMNARDTAMYWIEYIIRHKGAPHIRSAGLDLSWYQFYLLDVMAFGVLVVSSIIGVVYILIRSLVRRKKIKVKKN